MRIKEEQKNVKTETSVNHLNHSFNWNVENQTFK